MVSRMHPHGDKPAPSEAVGTMQTFLHCSTNKFLVIVCVAARLVDGLPPSLAGTAILKAKALLSHLMIYTWLVIQNEHLITHYHKMVVFWLSAIIAC